MSFSIETGEEEVIISDQNIGTLSSLPITSCPSLLLSGKKWGNPPTVVNTIHHIIGGASQRNYIARPLPGGGVLVDHLPYEGDDQAAPAPHPSSKGRSFFAFSTPREPSPVTTPLPPSFLQEEVTNPPTTPEEVEIEAASRDALKFLDFFTRLDSSGDKFISLEELQTILPPEGQSLLVMTTLS
jgi:hypothetical protein